MLILVFITVLGQFGVQTASIIAALGAAGLAIGLALQGTLQNIAAGIMLLILRPFRVGEYIEATNVKGYIKEIGLFATEMRTADGLYLMAPNSTLWNTPIINHSREPDRRQQLSVAMGEKIDINLARKTILDILKADQRIKTTPAPKVFSMNWPSIKPCSTSNIGRSPRRGPMSGTMWSRSSRPGLPSPT